MVVTATALNKVLKPDKMNYALLGNYIPHLHWHLIPRYKTESTWGQPICPHNQEEKTLSNSDYSRLIDRIRTAIMELRTASTR